MIISAPAKIEVTEFVSEVVSISTKWGHIRITDEGVMFARLSGSVSTFGIPSDEILDMCMAWMREQRRERNKDATNV